jgi:hypothetical protein
MKVGDRLSDAIFANPLDSSDSFEPRGGLLQSWRHLTEINLVDPNDDYHLNFGMELMRVPGLGSLHLSWLNVRAAAPLTRCVPFGCTRELDRNAV